MHGAKLAEQFYLTRPEIAKFLTDPRAQQRFDMMQRTVSSSDAAIQANIEDTQQIGAASYITLSANAELPNERVFRWTTGLKVVVDDNFATISLTAEVPRSSSGFRVNFTTEGDSSVALPLTGRLATTQNVEALENKTLVTPKLSGLGDYADDAAADAGGVPIDGVYRTGNALKIRIA